MAGARGPARRQLVGRLLGRRNRRRGARLRVSLGVVWRALAVAASMAALAGAWPIVRDAVRRHPYFAVQEVVVRHRGRLTPETIRAVAAIEPGTSIWDVDAVAAEARLAREPWVRSARVWHELPHRMVIEVREHRPAAIVSVTDPAPTLYYVASNGRIFAPVGPLDSHDYPYVTGLAAADLSGRDPFGPHAIRRSLALLRLLARERTGLGMISEVHVDRRQGVTLLPVRPAVPIELGSGDFAAKLGRLGEVLRLWAGHEAEIASVQCIFDDEVIVRTRPPAPVPKARRATSTTA